jgi:type II secretory pathway component PulJ
MKLVSEKWQVTGDEKNLASPAAHTCHSSLVTRHTLAFTLVEIMVAIMVFMLVIGAIYSSWMALLRSRQVAQSVAAQAQRQRITLHTIEDSLMAIQSFQASPQYYYFFLENGDEPVLSFAARVPEYFPRNGKFINPQTDRDFNLRRVTYTLESDGNGGKNLVLRQNPVLMDIDDDEQKYPLVLARDVRTFTVECWGTNLNNEVGWETEWPNTNAIPELVRVNLVLGGDKFAASSTPQFSVARIFSLPSQTMPASVHLGNGGSAAGGAAGGTTINVGRGNKGVQITP